MRLSLMRWCFITASTIFLSFLILFLGGCLLIITPQKALPHGDKIEDVLIGSFETCDGTITFNDDGTVISRGRPLGNELSRASNSREEYERCSYDDFLLDKNSSCSENVDQRRIYELKGVFSIENTVTELDDPHFYVTWQEINGIPIKPDYYEPTTMWFVSYNLWIRKYEIHTSGENIYRKVYLKDRCLINPKYDQFHHMD